VAGLKKKGKLYYYFKLPDVSASRGDKGVFEWLGRKK
jgi:hypothetical protein